jgi:hypothetical protein
MSVSGHAGTGVEPTDDDEGERVKTFIGDVLDAAKQNGLNLTIHSVSPERWALESMVVVGARSDGTSRVDESKEPGAEATGLEDRESESKG